MSATAALKHEHVWIAKPAYDKAERLYFERMAKVMSRKIMESCSVNSECSIINNHQDIIITNSLVKDKSKEKNRKSTKKENDCSIPKRENSKEMEKNECADIKEENNMNHSNKKCNAKEVKEKKNKADTRHRNRGKDKTDIKEQKEQLPRQATQPPTCPILPAGGSLAKEVAKARQHIKESLQCMDGTTALAGVSNQDVVSRITTLEKENQDLRNVVQELRNIIGKLDDRVQVLEQGKSHEVCPMIAICPPGPEVCQQERVVAHNDEDVDLFASDSEGDDTEAAKVREERLAAYVAKKSKKPAIIAKSNIILDVKPWDDETNMKFMETEVRKVKTDGLLWGAAKLVPLAFGIHKLQISCVVEDDKVSVDWLTEQIQAIEDYVQSVDIAAFNKV